MSDFKIIETQEQLDAIISERLRRDREAQAKKYEGWKSPEDMQKALEDLNAKVKALEDAATVSQQTIAEKDAEIAKSAKYKTDLEKTRIALAAGLKIEYADRLRGETQEEWEADAKVLAKDFGQTHATAPIGSNEPTITEKVDTAKLFEKWVNNTFNS